MKKVMVIFAIIIAMVQVSVFAQKVEFSMSGDVQFSTKNASTGTGLIFSEEPAIILHANPSIQYGKWSVTGFYSGHVGLDMRYHIVDILASYRVNDEISLYVGPEFTYKDLEGTDAVGAGLVGMMTWNRKSISSTLIYYTDPHFTIHYVIGSMSYNITKGVSISGLIAYTNAESTPVYGMVGVKYSKNSFFVGAYYSFRKDAPGPFFQVGIKF